MSVTATQSLWETPPMQFLFGETRVLSERRAWLVNAYANRAARDAHVPLSAFGNMYAGGEIPQVPEKMRVLIDGKYYGNCMIDRLDMSKIGMPETTAIEWLREFSGASVSIVHGPYGRSTVNASSNARTDVPLSSVNIVTSSTKMGVGAPRDHASSPSRIHKYEVDLRHGEPSSSTPPELVNAVLATPQNRVAIPDMRETPAGMQNAAAYVGRNSTRTGYYCGDVSGTVLRSDCGTNNNADLSLGPIAQPAPIHIAEWMPSSAFEGSSACMPIGAPCPCSQKSDARTISQPSSVSTSSGSDMPDITNKTTVQAPLAPIGSRAAALGMDCASGLCPISSPSSDACCGQPYDDANCGTSALPELMEIFSGQRSVEQVPVASKLLEPVGTRLAALEEKAAAAAACGNELGPIGSMPDLLYVGSDSSASHCQRPMPNLINVGDEASATIPSAKITAVAPGSTDAEIVARLTKYRKSLKRVNKRMMTLENATPEYLRKREEKARKAGRTAATPKDVKMAAYRTKKSSLERKIAALETQLSTKTPNHAVPNHIVAAVPAPVAAVPVPAATAAPISFRPDGVSGGDAKSPQVNGAEPRVMESGVTSPLPNGLIPRTRAAKKTAPAVAVPVEKEFSVFAEMLREYAASDTSALGKGACIAIALSDAALNAKFMMPGLGNTTILEALKAAKDPAAKIKYAAQHVGCLGDPTLSDPAKMREYLQGGQAIVATGIAPHPFHFELQLENGDVVISGAGSSKRQVCRLFKLKEYPNLLLIGVSEPMV